MRNLIEIIEKQNKNNMEVPGIEPGAFHMQSERSTAELHPQFRSIQPYALAYFHHTGSAWNAKLIFFGY